MNCTGTANGYSGQPVPMPPRKAEERPRRPKVVFPFNTTIFLTLKQATPAGPYASIYENGRPSWLYKSSKTKSRSPCSSTTRRKRRSKRCTCLQGGMIAITRKEVRLPSGKAGSDWIIFDPYAPPPQKNSQNPFPARSADEINAGQHASELASPNAIAHPPAVPPMPRGLRPYYPAATAHHITEQPARHRPRAKPTH